MSSCFQCLYPHSKTETQGKGSTDNHQPTLGAQPASISGQEKRREREQKGDEDEDCVHNTSYNVLVTPEKSVVASDVPRFKPPLCCNIGALIRFIHHWTVVVPVNGHWPSSSLCVTLSTVGVFRSNCSDKREKPKINPPHPAKRKSMPTKTIISLVGILAVCCATALYEEMTGWKRTRKECKSSAAEPSGVLSRLR